MYTIFILAKNYFLQSIVYLVKMLVSQSVHFSKALPGGEKMFMLGLAGFCWPIWKARNRVCFEKKPLRDPSDFLLSLLFHLILGRFISR
jgi:hypothetical protein